MNAKSIFTGIAIVGAVTAGIVTVNTVNANSVSPQQASWSGSVNTNTGAS